VLKRLQFRARAVKRLFDLLYQASKTKQRYRRDQPNILLDVNDPSVYRRYYITLAYCLANLPANVRWNFRFRYFAVPGECDELRWWNTFPIILPPISRRLVNFDAIITDRPHDFLGAACRIIRIATIDGQSEYSASNEDTVQLPILAHPTQLLTDRFISPPDFRGDMRRKHRIAYAGNCDPKLYSGQYLGKHLIARIHAIDTIRNSLSDSLLLIDDWQDKHRIPESSAPIVIVNSLRAGLAYGEFTELFRNSEFSLPLPGISSPFTHFLHETIYQGCIPIMQESLLTRSIWRNEENCLIYNDERSLIKTIERALAAPQDFISFLRNNLQRTILSSFSIPLQAKALTARETKTIVLRNA
jgi:hypothetical protein